MQQRGAADTQQLTTYKMLERKYGVRQTTFQLEKNSKKALNSKKRQNKATKDNTVLRHLQQKETQRY
eukprot:11313402-Ditylum_brightwellii.AAC.1